MIVALDAGWGWAFYEWHTDMSEEEFIQWWQNLEDIGPYATGEKSLPGKLIEAETMPKAKFALALESNNNSYLINTETGQIFNHKGYDTLS